jgi:hypothetical protein
MIMSATLTYPHSRHSHHAHIEMPYRKVAVTLGVAAFLWGSVMTLGFIKNVQPAGMDLLPDYARYQWVGFYRTEAASGQSHALRPQILHRGVNV